MFLLMLPFASAELIDYQDDERYSVYAPEKINVFEPVPVIIKIHDEDYLYALEEVRLSRCLLPLGQFFGLEDFSYEGISLNSQTPVGVNFQWPEGEEKIEFEVSMPFGGSMSYTKSDYRQGLSCSVRLAHNIDKLRDKMNLGDNVMIDMRGSTSLSFDFYDFDFGIENLPSGYVETTNSILRDYNSIQERLDDFGIGSSRFSFKKEYEKQEGDFSSKIILDIADGTEFTYQDFMDADAVTEKTFKLYNHELESNAPMDFKLGPGQFAKRCNDRDNYREISQNNEYTINCFYYTTIFSFAGPIIMGGNYKDKVFYGQGEQERAKALDEVERKKSEFENKIIDFANNIYFQSDGENLEFEFEIEEKEEEEKEVARKEFEISFRNRDSDTIWNRGRVSGEEPDHIVILTKIEGKAFDEDGKEVKVSQNELFSGVNIVTKIEDNQSQIGIGANQRNELTRSVTRDLETIELWGKSPRRYEGFYKPLERLNVHLEYNGKIASNEITYTINVDDASPRIILRNPLIEVQDGERRVIHFKVEDDDKSELKCSIMIPSRFAVKRGIPNSYLTHNNQETTLVEIDCKDGDEIQVIFNAPNLGNFNLNNELNALNMWKYQEDTMKTLAKDIIGLGVDKRLEYLKEKRSLLEATGSLEQAQQYADAFDALDRANKLSDKANKVIDLAELPSDVVESTRDHFESASDVGERTASREQGWIEWGADWGVYGIDLAQTTVGAISKAPGRVPIVGPLGKKMGSGFSTTFNLMTNVWKGNFEYLSNVERVNRAEEMAFPYPVIITIEDEDGFVTKEVQNMMVKYNWLN